MEIQDIIWRYKVSEGRKTEKNLTFQSMHLNFYLLKFVHNHIAYDKMFYSARQTFQFTLIKHKIMNHIRSFI